MNFKKIANTFLLTLTIFNGFSQQIETDFQWNTHGSFVYSMFVPAGQLSKYLPNYGCLGGGIEFSYKQFLADFNFFRSDLSSLKKDFNFNGVWLNNTPTQLKYPEVIFGYSPINLENIRLSILTGVSQPKIKVSEEYLEDHHEYRGKSIYSSFTPQFGLSLDFYVSAMDKPSQKVFKNTSMKFYYYFRTRFLYQFTDFQRESSSLKGGAYVFQVALGISARYLHGPRHRI